MGKRRSVLVLQRLSNLIKISIFIAKMRLIHLKRSAKFSNFKLLKHHNNSYAGFLQERRFSPSTTPLISFRRRKANGGSSFYSICFLSCFNGGHHHGVVLDENYSMESAIVEGDKCGLDDHLLYGHVQEQDEEEEEGSVDERAERFIEWFYEEMKRQRRDSLGASSTNVPFNRMIKY